MTFSVVARCKRTGQFGVGIATYSPNVGGRCPLIVPGMGAASIQSVANPQLNLIARTLLAQGLSATKVVSDVLASDPFPDYRQIAVVDVYGHAHAATGSRNAAWAGHQVGDGFVCSGNVLVGEQVVTAMAQAFSADSDLELAERLVRSIEAGRNAGGQPEGQNSSALLVYDRQPFPIVDLRVELHDEPVGDLRRLWDWYAPMVPYYIERAFSPNVPRWWQWRQKHVPGWTPRHLA
ncbi:MAG: DUF1028 domain-containing protein [Betaproteobacteria bacterium]|nr:MAG: DUF1028 domain-containing protein [Betaproteobacteria bacterium]